MDAIEGYLEGTTEPEDIPYTRSPVYLLGKEYNAIHELPAIRRDILSKLWFSYRRSFVPIGGDDGLTTDKGWGCMLRCGQMVLAQALITQHLGRDWTWEPSTKDSTYLRILNKFMDKRHAPYSIHQIAMTGVSENKEVGQWFGPNTVAQVLKKLVKYDDWGSLAIHVALDNALIISEIKELCSKQNEACSKTIKLEETNWKPLLLVVPLRLGLQEINPIYTSGLQKCFRFKQSLGVIGGKPNLALYFIGCVDEEVIYLDPHTTQKSGSVENKETDEEVELDSTYHCKCASRLNILSIDPSVALCFFCRTEEEFNDLCNSIKKHLIEPEKQPLFELAFERPKQWTPTLDAAVEAAEFVDSIAYDSETDFEIL